MRQQGTWGYLKDNLTNRGWSAWLLTSILLVFYLILYNQNLPILGPVVGEGVRQMTRPFVWIGLMGEPTSNPFGVVAEAMGLIHKWNFYGLLYSIAIVVGGLYVIKKYRRNAYQIVRTIVVMVVQVTLGFSIPYILELFNQPALYFSYLWPLEIDILYPDKLSEFPVYFAIWAVVGSIVVAPLLGIFYGKRWYCSWVCGCGGLANTAGEPFRHLTPTTRGSWQFEKYAIHGTLIVSLLATGLVGASYLLGDEYTMLNEFASHLRRFYGVVFVTAISGILGVVLYPIGGTRIWCRNFCPMAAVLGIVQKPGRFQIRVKDNMCISCGLCSKYCEMGIDVRAYAQTNQNFTRAACVGCGLCEEVCPRGVLHLENNWDNEAGTVSLNDELIRSREVH